VKSGALHERLLEIGYVPVGSTAAEFRARIDSEIDKWMRIILAANIKPN
jgi:tripartite-type tricarboxylate transporter receptor subunit TctC